MNLTCFKAYDIRGKLGEDLNAEIARRIGRAYADVMAVGSVIVGHDARESSPVLKAALVEGLRTGGVNVTDIGLCGSEEVYFATGHLHKGGGIMVTASHNPIDYNGMKMVGPGSRPLDPATEMKAIKTAAERDSYQDHPHYGTYAEANPRNGLAAHVAGMVDGRSLQGLHVVANAGNGTAGATFDAVVA
ncbi:MAG: phosphomannomutase, partial [Pseudomonadota bacterium]